MLFPDPGVRFTPEYICFDASGEIVESGLLADEPCFVAASRLAKSYAKYGGFMQLAIMGPEFNAVNDVLLAGAEPKNLVYAPIYVYLEEPTPAGDENARRVIDQNAAALLGPAARARKPAVAGNPWWRFWS